MKPRKDATRALLANCFPLDANERAHLEAMVDLLHTEAPFSRHQFVPGHFTASVFALSPDCHSLLLIHHAKLNRWLQPGGHVESTDPDCTASALRELAEETGLTRPQLLPGLFDVDVHQIPASSVEPAHLHFDLRFCAIARSREVTAASDALDARWVPLDEISAQESDASVLRAVDKLKQRFRPQDRSDDALLPA